MEKTSLLIPSAGKSSRFPNKPKWLLTQPNGNLMIYDCIRGLNLKNIDKIYIGVLKEHIDKFCNGSTKCIEKSFKNHNIKIMIIKEQTRSQCETVCKMIKHFKIKNSIFIKDVDNYYEHTPKNENAICFVDINNYKNISNLAGKSFIKTDNLNIIKNIVEKRIISDKICVGGYSIKESNKYLELFNKFMNNNEFEINEMYTSHIIWNMILNKNQFIGINVNNYYDWGTYEDWINYKNQYMTLFIDIDGTIFENTGQFTEIEWGDNKPIEKNLLLLKKLRCEKNIKIIFTTSRTLEYKEKTKKQFEKYQVPYDDIIFNLPHCSRYLINDFAPTNVYPSSIAINIPRNGNLEDYLNF